MYFILLVVVFYPVGKHGIAKRAGGSYYVGIALQNIFGALHVYVYATGFVFFKHLRTAGTAAQAFGATAFHFYQFGI